MTLSKFMDAWLGLWGAASIALLALGYGFPGAIAGLLSEPGFFYASWRSRLLSMWLLSSWWTVWWAVLLWRNWP